ncbi:MAG: DUF3575 domain-containing protein [Bacteroidales bacterium]|nr:DUF3575 domain-containing protein [Bacteroidales bacterium]
MNNMSCFRGKFALLAVMFCLLSGQIANSQSYIRYIKLEDIGTKTLYADSVLTSIMLPRGVARLVNYPKFNAAVYELSQVLQDPSKELLQVWICGSTCPDGLWGENVTLSQARTDAAAEYLTEITGIPEYKIHKESLNEDWDRLAELVAASDLPYKAEILYIIRTKKWGERKTALQKLDGGKVWKTLQKDFFPKLRCVRFAIYCKWDPTKPYLTAPVEEPVMKETVVETAKDTVYVRDTVFVVRQPAPVVVVKDTVYVDAPVAQPVEVQTQVQTPVQNPVTATMLDQAYEQYRAAYERPKKYWDTPWMMGLKTNLIADALAVPMVGVEFQIGKSVSLDIEGWLTHTNIFCKEDTNTNFYGLTPELRWWIKGNTMRKGSFVGVHARLGWYTMQWTDGLLYQNGPKDVWEGNFHDAGNSNPAWSAGFTYGYSLGLGHKANWGIEFLLGVGYAHYAHNTAAYNGTMWEFVEHQDKHHFGITRAGINLTYRFSLRRVKPEFYENN